MVHVSMWRIRDLKRQEARRRDKDAIAQLQRQVAQLEAEVRAWQQWYCESDPGWWHADENPRVETVLSNLASEDIKQGGLRMAERGNFPEGTRASCIDYSKWEHIGSGSSSMADSDEYVLGDHVDVGCGLACVHCNGLIASDALQEDEEDDEEDQENEKEKKTRNR